MSHEATCWAVKQRGLSCAAKVVLWHLADRFHPDNGCFPQQSRLAADCEMSRSSLNVQLDALEKAGLIRREQRHDEGTRQRLPTRYRLGFETGFRPLKCAVAPVENPVDDMGETGPETDAEAAETHVQNPDMDPAEPCPEKGQSHVQLNGHGYKAEPVSEPVRLRESAGASPDGRTSAGGSASGEPTIEAFRDAYPAAAYEAQTRLETAWDALPVSSQAAALAAVTAFIEAGRQAGRKYLPKAAEYLEKGLWQIAEVRAVQVKAAGKAVGSGGVAGGIVQVERWTRDWWGVLLWRLSEGRPVASAWGVSSLAVPGNDPALRVAEGLRQFPSTGTVAMEWLRWLRGRGCVAPWGRDETVWLWLPGETAGDFSKLRQQA